MRLYVAVVVAGLLCSSVSQGGALQRVALELGSSISTNYVIPPQLLWHLSGKKGNKDILQHLLHEHEQQLLAKFPFEQAGSFSRGLRELLQQALRQAQDRQLADFNDMSQHNIWEGLSLFSFTYGLGSDVRFYLDSQYGTHTLISNTRYGGIGGFSIIAPQEQREVDFSTITAVNIEQDFLTLQSLSAPVFTPRHYVFHGEQYVYVLNRETLALEYVVHSDTQIDDELSFANRVHKIALVDDELLSVRYRKARRREFVQLIDLNHLTTIHAREIEGMLLAVAPQGARVAVQNNRQLEVIDLDRGRKHLFPSQAATSVQFSADGERLAYIDGDTLNLVSLTTSALQIPQRLALASEQTLVNAETPSNELLWDGEYLFVMHRATLAQVTSSGKIVWQQDLPDNMHALQSIDEQHLALFSEQGMLLYNKEDGTPRLQLAVDKKQRIADQAFADRYLSLLLEDLLHLNTFSLTLARIPLVQLLQLLEASPLLQKIAATEKFTLKRGRPRFAELVLDSVERHLQQNQIPIAQLVQLLRELYQAYHLISGSYYAFTNIADMLLRHEDEVVALTADDPAFQQLLHTSFL